MKKEKITNSKTVGSFDANIKNETFCFVHKFRRDRDSLVLTPPYFFPALNNVY